MDFAIVEKILSWTIPALVAFTGSWAVLNYRMQQFEKQLSKNIETNEGRFRDVEQKVDILESKVETHISAIKSEMEKISRQVMDGNSLILQRIVALETKNEFVLDRLKKSK